MMLGVGPVPQYIQHPVVNSGGGSAAPFLFLFVGGLVLIALIYLAITPRGGHPGNGDDGWKGWWGRWKPQVPPPGPKPLPRRWSPPDFIPQWMVEEVGPVVIPRLRSRDLPDEGVPARLHRPDSSE